MNRDETSKLLELLYGAYPNTKIRDPQSMLTTWELTLGDYSAESVYKAARLHMATSKFFPSPAEIRDKMVKADILYTARGTSKTLLTASKMAKADKRWEPFCDALCEKLGFGCEPNEDIDLRDYLPEGEEMPNFLPYEQ